MDPDQLKRTAIEKGFISRKEADLLSERETFLLTCRPGFSTAKEITDTSGRGVGMDVANASIRALGGSITIESRSGLGTKIVLKLPLTIAIINVLLATCADFNLALPVNTIDRTMEIRREMISSQGRKKVFFLNGEPIPLISLAKIFDKTVPNPPNGIITLFISEVKGRRMGFIVDNFLGYQEIFVKPLGKPMNSMRGLTGGGILGNGDLVFILDVPNLF